MPGKVKKSRNPPKPSGNVSIVATGAKFRGIWQERYPSLEGLPIVILGSIMGNLRCEGTYLQHSIQTALSAGRQVIYLVADEIYWHNLKPNTEVSTEQMAALKHESLLMGEAYIRRNLSYFCKGLGLESGVEEQLSPLPIDPLIAALNQLAADTLALKNAENPGNAASFELIRWAGWQNKCHEYSQLEREIMARFRDVPVLRKSVEDAAAAFVERRKEAGAFTEAELSLVFERSQHYVAEETAALVWIAAKLGIPFIAYPGKGLDFIEQARVYFTGPIRSSRTGEVFDPIRSADPLCINIEPGKPLATFVEIHHLEKKVVEISSSTESSPVPTPKLSRPDSVPILDLNHLDEIKAEESPPENSLGPNSASDSSRSQPPREEACTPTISLISSIMRTEYTPQKKDALLAALLKDPFDPSSSFRTLFSSLPFFRSPPPQQEHVVPPSIKIGSS